MIDILTRDCDGCQKPISSANQISISFLHKKLILCKHCIAVLSVELQKCIDSSEDLKHELLLVVDEYNLEW